jgi:hypothetical protein
MAPVNIWVAFANRVITWLVFFVIVAVAWDQSLGITIRRLKTDVIDGNSSVTLRRPYLIALCAYSIAIAWAWIAAFALVAYGALTMLVLIVGFADPDYLAFLVHIVRMIALPNLVLHCFDAAHAPFHAVATLATLAASSVAIGFYVSEEDLEDETKASVLSKTVRLLFIAPFVMISAYVIYVGYVFLVSVLRD